MTSVTWSTICSAFLDADDGRLSELKAAPAAIRTVGVLTEVAGRLDEAGAEVSFDDLAAALGLFDTKTRDRLRLWSRLEFGKAETKCLGDDVELVAGLAGTVLSRLDGLRGLDPEAFGAARAVLLSLLREVEAKRAERGIATFADLLVKTARLLEEHDGICRSERRGMDQLLVDEFQDTDDVQCRIVRRLALDGPEDQRPGLFVVGDPKQSIYAWRSADLAAYDGFVDDVKAAGGEKHPLTSNFRSVRPILEEVELLVKPVMHEEHGFQPAFEGLDATDDRIAVARIPTGAVERRRALELPIG